MTWLTPMIGAVAAAIAVPTLLILYFLKLRRRDMEVSTTLLWKKAIQDLQANAPFQRLRRNLLLFLQLLILAAAALALAQPQWRTQTFQTQRHIILIDRSASMAATDTTDARGEPVTRLEQAKKQAGAMVESMRAGGVLSDSEADEAMVIAFDTEPVILQQFTRDRSVLKAAIESIKPTEAPTSIETTMAAALAHLPKRIVEGSAVEGLTGGPPVTIHIYSDGRIPDADKAKPGPENHVEYHMVGRSDAPNAGITSIRAQRSFDNPARLTVFVGLENNEPVPRAVDVQLVLDGAVAGIKGTTIPGAASDLDLSPAAAARTGAREREAGEAAPGAEAPAPAAPVSKPGAGGVIFALDHPEGTLAEVRLLSPSTGNAIEGDALALDNRGYLAIPPAKKIGVAVVGTRPNIYVATALGGLPLSRLTEFSPAQWEEQVRQGKAGEYDVVVLDGWLPESLPEEPGLPPGRYLVLGQVPGGSSGLSSNGEPAQGVIIDWAREHPVMRGLALDNVLIAKAPRLSVSGTGGASVLATSDRGAAVLEINTAVTRAVVVAFDPLASTWPFDVSFVVFVAQAVKHLGEEAGLQQVGRQVQPGQVVRDRLPAGAQGIRLELPDGESQELVAAADGTVIFGPIPRTGRYTVRWTGAAGPTDAADGSTVRRYYASNLADPAESDIRAAERIALASTEVQASRRTQTEGVKRAWPWLLLGALLIVMLEWYIYNRKVYV